MNNENITLKLNIVTNNFIVFVNIYKTKFLLIAKNLRLQMYIVLNWFDV